MFVEKLQKSSNAGGSAPRPPPKPPIDLKNPGYASVCMYSCITDSQYTERRYQ